MSEVTAPEVLYKQPAEVLTLSMDFTARLPAGTHIDAASITVVPNTITASIGGIVDGVVQINFADGVDNTNYRVNVIAELSDGVTILEGDGILKVRDK